MFKRESHLNLPMQDGTTETFTCYHYISKQNTPELLEKFSNAQIFQFVHPKTGEIAPVDYPMVYEDLEKQFLVFYNPSENIANDTITPAAFEGLDADYTNFTMRLTTELTDFYEKITIFNAGQLDTEVECVRILTFTLLKEQQPELKNYNLYYDEIDAQQLFVIAAQQGQTTVEYPSELVNYVHSKLGEQLDLPKGLVHEVSVKWAIEALELGA